MNIKRVQSQLNKLGFGPLEVDGIAGQKTYAAITHFQEKNHLTADGLAGPATLTALFPEEQPEGDTLAILAMNFAKLKEGVRELTGNNDGPEVEAYLKAVGLGKGNSWCMAFVVWCYDQAAQKLGVTNPLVRTGGCLRQWNETSCKKSFNPKVGDIFIINLGHGAGHTGIVTGVDGSTITTIEGNTNNNGSANGDGVYTRERRTSQILGYIRAV